MLVADSGPGIWNAIGIDLGWLFLVMGLLIGGAVFPAAFTITWRKQTKAGAIAGAVGGLAAGLLAWLLTAWHYYGALTIETTGLEYPTLAGNLAAIMTGIILTVVISYIKPDNFDWEITRAINAKNATIIADSDSASSQAAPAPAETVDGKEGDPEKAAETSGTVPATPAAVLTTTPDPSTVPPPHELASSLRLALIASSVLTFVFVILIPMPMFGSHYIFSKHFFTGWVVISFMWVFTSTFISVLLPLWETRNFFTELAGKITHDLRGRRKG